MDFSRHPASSVAHDLVAWWWICTWDIAPGQQSSQEVLAFPSSNLTFEKDGIRYCGPTTRRSTQVLTGQGWVLGALLRPAAVPSFTQRPADYRNAFLPVAAPLLHEVVQASAHDLASIVGEVDEWLAERVGSLTDEALQANRMAELAITDSSITSVSSLADAMAVSPRTLNRLAAKYVGLSPYTMIRRRRLQEAVQQARENLDAALADIAAQHGFTDQAHLSREARAMLGLTLTDYRTRARNPQ